jgi:peptide-methionine (R)-S-oxide reductase
VKFNSVSFQVFNNAGKIRYEQNGIDSGSKDLGDFHWKNVLSDSGFRVMRMKKTDPRGVTREKGGFDDFYDDGIYHCAACKSPLYESSMKFDCGCGWPGFWTNLQGKVAEIPDADGSRVEITCEACRSHLGHVFRNEGFKNPEPNERHCVNSSSLIFIPQNSGEEVKCSYLGPVY